MKNLAAMAGISALLAVPSIAFADSLTVATWGGSYTQKQRSVLMEPFTKKAGTEVRDAVYTGGLGQIRAMVEARNTVWDVITLGSPETINACAEGAIVELDKSKLTHAADFPPGGITPCGIGSVGWSLVLAYNSKLTGEQPKTWADFWDLKKYPGKRALRRQPKATLEIALLADGVAREDVYKVMRTPAGIDRAFRKLDEIKSSIRWWEAGAQPSDWLSSGNVVMSTSFIGRILEARAEGAPLGYGWQDAFYTIDYWTIVSGGKNIERAYEFINFASSPEAQAAFSAIQPVAPVNGKSAGLLAPDRLPLMPVGKNLEQNVRYDEQFWNDNLETLNERFNAWLAKG